TLSTPTLLPCTTLFRSHARRGNRPPRCAADVVEIAVGAGLQPVRRDGGAAAHRGGLPRGGHELVAGGDEVRRPGADPLGTAQQRSEEHTSELQSRFDLV